MKLMIVDDHAGAREMIRKILNLPGLTICECASGSEALRRASEFQPDWVTMDLQMPGQNGFQCADAFRLECPSAQVVILTSFNEPHFQQLARTVGAAAIVSKENLMALRAMLANALNRSNSSATTADLPFPEPL
jgi:two-component system response regulator EvgA